MYGLIIPLLIGFLVGVVVLILVYCWNIRKRRSGAASLVARETGRYGRYIKSSYKLAGRYRPRYNNRAFHSLDDVFGGF